MSGALICGTSVPRAVKIDNTLSGASITVSFSAEDRQVTIGDHGQAVYEMRTNPSSHAAYFTRDGNTSLDSDGMAAQILKDIQRADPDIGAS
jgi:hypothetical protein